MPYNDATLEYLDRHLEDERSKVVAGGSRDKLERLTQYRIQYEQHSRRLYEEGRGPHAFGSGRCRVAVTAAVLSQALREGAQR